MDSAGDIHGRQRNKNLTTSVHQQETYKNGRDNCSVMRRRRLRWLIANCRHSLFADLATNSVQHSARVNIAKTTVVINPPIPKLDSGILKCYGN